MNNDGRTPVSIADGVYFGGTFLIRNSTAIKTIEVPPYPSTHSLGTFA